MVHANTVSQRQRGFWATIPFVLFVFFSLSTRCVCVCSFPMKLQIIQMGLFDWYFNSELDHFSMSVTILKGANEYHPIWHDGAASRE